ncbi:histidine phosphatase family protein [Nocardioides sp. YIM 152588]|uniref:histidine phosphatase family protein n=1 Tax=Nocardioides sp. YIM 152588 TaxID=3158259 RepID=UPI0032E3F544
MHRRIRPLAVLAATLPLIAAGTLTASDAAVATGDRAPRPENGYTLLFVRHAATDYSPPEEELNAEGIEQAAALAEALHDEPIDAVYTSMMVRAFQTGDDVAADHDLPLIADAGISEVGFDVEAFPEDVNPQLYLYEILTKWLNGVDRDQGFGGESYDEVAARWGEWWASVVAEHRNDRGTGVVVAHGAVLGLMLPATCATPVPAEFALRHPLPNTGIIEARLERNGTLTCLTWDGTPLP